MTDNQPTSDASANQALPTFQAPQPPDPTPTTPTFEPTQPQPTFQPAEPQPVQPQPVSPRPASRRRGIVDIVLVVAAIFAVGGVGFALGRATAPAAIAQTGARVNGQFGNGNFGGQFPNGGEFPNGGQGATGQGGVGALGRGLGITLSGEVTEVSADHLTLKLANGQSIKIGLSGTTTYHTQTPATAADVTAGSTVQVQVGRGGGAAGGTANGGTPQLGDASSVTVVPK